jgi:hypothetical protein
MSEEVARKISDTINSLGLREDEVAKLLANEHPTLQQQFMNIAVHFIVEMSKKASCDQRNFCSVEKAKRIVKNMDYTDINGECPFL